MVDGQARPPAPRRSPVEDLVLRVGLALALLLLVAATVYLGRDGYRDADGDGISVLDALYYASVSVTTTGYGDITPVTPGARLATTVIVTPARIGFLLLVVGTTVELLTERWRSGLRRERWRRRVKDHHVICGYGVKGRAAVRALLDDGVAAADIVVVEASSGPLEEASRAGLTVVRGDSSRTATLNEARIALARTVIIATDRDDNAVLTTLTARELAPGARIIASVREEENRHLLEQSGADSVITSSETAGRLLGVTALHPQTAKVVEDLLDTAHGLRLVEREIGPEGPGPDTAGEVPVAVVRAGRLLRIDAVGCLPLRQGDLLVSLAGEAEPAR
ncbi:MAG: hypothetical protein RLZZ272_835 [Actinomycetota bacterium]